MHGYVSRVNFVRGRLVACLLNVMLLITYLSSSSSLTSGENMTGPGSSGRLVTVSFPWSGSSSSGRGSSESSTSPAYGSSGAESISSISSSITPCNLRIFLLVSKAIDVMGQSAAKSLPSSRQITCSGSGVRMAIEVLSTVSSAPHGR